MKFRKKPVVIEAFQLTAERAFDCLAYNKPFEFGLHLSGDFRPVNRTVDAAWVTIKTLEGNMRAELGDWIIKGVKGELYPCKPDIFEATYDKEPS